MKKRALFVLAGIAALVLMTSILTGCARKETKTAKSVAVLTPYLSSTTTKQMVDILEKNIREKGWNPTTVDTKNDFAALASRMEDLVTSKVDAIVVVSADPSQIADQIKQADAAGIPVFGCDSGFIDGVTVNATSDNYQMSELITNYLFDKIDHTGSLVILTHRPHPGIFKRNERLEQILAQNPNIKVVTEQHVDVPNPIENARTVMENVLLGNAGDGAITAVWCAWDEAAIGAVQAINDAGRTGIIVTGIDGNAQAVEYIDQGSALAATIEQNFTGMAEIVIQELENYFAGKTLERGDRYAPAILYSK
ncbi:MAG: substrate-binding domain-containing protein [Treponema sp.]|jgi:ribose transport system substrate-binding protein|nr:substrate-binding domain-containing protein [Treponema sp.]